MTEEGSSNDTRVAKLEASNGRRYQRRMVIIDTVLPLIMLIAILGILISVLRWNREPVLTFGEVQPLTQTACPGQQVMYEYDFTIQQAPSVVILARSLWSLDRVENIVSTDALGPFVWDTNRIQFQRDGTPFQIPRGLAPGDYELRVAAVASTPQGLASPTYFRVPVTVPNDCIQLP